MVKFSKETQKIVDAHKSDFNCTNYESKLKEYGGYSAYINSLGGVFKKYNGKNVNARTEAEFQEAAEYVFGLMAIYGFDYNNNKRYVRWQGGSPFYTGSNKGKCNGGKIDDLCKSKGKTTCCNYAMDALYFKAGLMGGKNQVQHSASFTGQVKTYKKKVIRNAKELKVGDLIHMFSSKITSDNPSTWAGWGHVCCVGEIENGKIITYDGGSRFMKTGNYKHVFKVDANNKCSGDYSYAGWVGIRIEELSSGDSIETEAIQLIHDKKPEVIELAYHYMTDKHDDYLRACVDFIFAGKAGNGDVRKQYFGKAYDEVQGKVEWTKKTALEVLEGKWGNGQERKDRLGPDYDIVQHQVNRLKNQ